MNGLSADLPIAVNMHGGGAGSSGSGGSIVVDMHTATRAGGSPVKDLLGNNHPGSASADAACPRSVTSPIGQTRISRGRHMHQTANAFRAVCTVNSLSASPVREQHRSGGRRRAHTHSGPSLSSRNKPLCLMPSKQGGNGQEQSTQLVGQRLSTQVDKRWHEYMARAKQKQALQLQSSSAAQHSSPVRISQSPCKPAYLIRHNVGWISDALLNTEASVESQLIAVLAACCTQDVVRSGG